MAPPPHQVEIGRVATTIGATIATIIGTNLVMVVMIGRKITLDPRNNMARTIGVLTETPEGGNRR